MRFLGGRVDEHDVGPSVLLGASARLRDHVGTLFDPDDRALRPDVIFEMRKAQTGAAAKIEHGLPGLETQARDGAAANRFSKRNLEVVNRDARTILLNRLGAIGLGGNRRLTRRV